MFLALLLLVLAGPVAAAHAGSPAATRLIVRLAAPGTAPEERLRAMGAARVSRLFAGHIRPEDPLARFWTADFPEGQAVERALATLEADPSIESAEPDVVLPLQDCAPGDPFFRHPDPDSTQWSLDSNDRGPDLDVLEAWNVTRGDPSVVIAVLDSGVEWRHPDFGPPLSPGGTIWTNAAEALGTEGVDDDGNGFVDDVRGWDFVDVATIPGESTQVDPMEDGFVPDNDPVDFDGHGTIVAGIIGPRADDGLGLAGTAPGCRVMPLRVGWRRLNTGGVVAMSFCAQAVVYAADNGARVLNCSWLSDPLDALVSAVDYAIGVKGVVLVDAAGNGALTESQSRNYLSRRGDGIDVAAARRDGGPTAATSIGRWVDLSAPSGSVGPGLGLLSLATLGGPRLYRRDTSGGTSFAAPFVSAAAGLVLSVNAALTPEEVRRILMDSAVSLDERNPFYAGKLGAGLVNAGAALHLAAGRVRLGLDSPPAASPAALADGSVVLADRDGRFLRLTRDGDIAVSTGVSRFSAVTGFASHGPDGLDFPGRHVFGMRSGHLVLTDEEGGPLPGWPRPIGGLLLGNPVLVDLTGDGVPEVVAAGTDSMLHAWDVRGVNPGAFPRRLTDAVVTSPAAGDLDGDGRPEVVVVTIDGRVHAFRPDGTTPAGWPVGPVSAPGRRSPILADLDGDVRLEVIVPGPSGLHAFHGTGVSVSGWPVTLPGPPVLDIAAADMDADGRAEILAAGPAGRIHVIRGSGLPGPGWPVDLGEPVSAGPLAVVVDGGTSPAILVTTASHCLVALDALGRRVPGWSPGFDVSIAAAAGADIVSPDGGSLWIAGDDAILRRVPIPLTGAPDPAPWGMPGGNPARTRALRPTARPPASPRAETGGATIAFSPNPWPSGPGTITIDIERPSPGEILLFDIHGRLVRRLWEGNLEKGETRLTWDGRDGRGRPLPSGVYGFTFRWAGGTRSGRLLRVG